MFWNPKLVRIISGVAAVLIVFSLGSSDKAGYAQQEVGKIASTAPAELRVIFEKRAPTASELAESTPQQILEDSKRRDLAEASGFYVQVVCEGRVDGISQTDVERWVMAELGRSAPNAQTINRTEFAKRILDRQYDPYSAKDLQGILSRIDYRQRSLKVSADFMKTESGTTFYHIQVSFRRGGIIPTGLAASTVYEDKDYGYFASNYSAVERVRPAVQALVQKFADTWVIANKPAQ